MDKEPQCFRGSRRVIVFLGFREPGTRVLRVTAGCRYYTISITWVAMLTSRPARGGDVGADDAAVVVWCGAVDWAIYRLVEG